MLLWAMFTSGFIFGVLLTLSVVLGKEEVEYGQDKESSRIDALEYLSPWEIHDRIIKPNVKITQTITETSAATSSHQKHPVSILGISPEE